MNEETKADIVVNASNAWRMASNWVMTAAGAVSAIYLTLPIEQQQTLVEHLPVPPWAIPVLMSAIGIAARLWPQPKLQAAITSSTTAKKGTE